MDQRSESATVEPRQRSAPASFQSGAARRGQAAALVENQANVVVFPIINERLRGWMQGS
jgi:hypothetical protein